MNFQNFLANYFANTYNYGNISGGSKFKYQFGRDIDAYNSYAIDGSADSTGSKVTDSYTYDAYAALGTGSMTYYNMEDGEEVQGTLLEALNHWVQYRADNLGETYVAWKQGEKYPELDIEWDGLEFNSSSSSVSIALSSSSTIVSSSSELMSSSVEISSSSGTPSSSSASQESSSSSFGENSSSSTKSDFVMTIPQKKFNLAVNGMTLTLSNTQGGTVQIFDALGHLVTTRLLSANGSTNITMPTAGSYIVRVNGETQMVTLR